jgi:hypothetical protein
VSAFRDAIFKQAAPAARERAEIRQAYYCLREHIPRLHDLSSDEECAVCSEPSIDGGASFAQLRLSYRATTSALRSNLPRGELLALQAS